MPQLNLLEQSKGLSFRKQYSCSDSIPSNRLHVSQQNRLLLKYASRKGDFFNQKPFSGLHDQLSLAKFSGIFMRSTMPLIEKLKTLDDLISAESNLLEINFDSWAIVFKNNYNNSHLHIKQRNQEWFAFVKLLELLDQGLISTSPRKTLSNTH